MELLHTRLLVSKFPACFRFYRDVLKLKPSWGDEADSYASFTQEPGGKIVLAIFSRQAMAQVVGRQSWPADPPAQDKCLLIFKVSDVDDTVDQLRQKGMKFEIDPTNFPDWGIRCAYLRDPDGNLIELSSELPSDSWSPGLQEAARKWEERK